jgi:predicted CXXCH cytochrome family protein
MRRARLIFALLTGFAGSCFPGPKADAQQQKAPATVKQPIAPKDGFAGAETCAMCHADVATKFKSNPHSELALMHGGKGVTCESCHGPGEAHVASGGDPTKILQLSKVSARQIDTTCLGCHAGAHPNFLRSDHGKAGVGCTSCHSIHGLVAAASQLNAAAPVAGAEKKSQSKPGFFDAFKPDSRVSDPVQWAAASVAMPDQNQDLLKAPQPQLCFSCHSDVKPAFSQPFHHPVNEGLVKCTDCHDTHGTFGNNQLRSTADQNMICTKCHTETRGPFVFEHAAVKAEGCVGCHTPHGSQNARLLNVPNINQMCNQCHSPVAAGTIHGMNAGSAEVQSCISCHTMIHGSNINSAFIR